MPKENIIEHIDASFDDVVDAITSNAKETTLLKATYSSEITLGNIAIPCHVLEDGSRVVSGRGMQNSLGFSKTSSGSALQVIVNSKLTDFIPSESLEQLHNPRGFLRIGSGGSAPETNGFDATILIDICDALISAKKAGKLTQLQEKYADYAEIIIRSVAKIGIIALIDEATGYQDIRKKDALQRILDAFVSKELAAWVKRFPDEFYDEMFRLKKWKWSSKLRPSVVGRYTNDIVYDRLAPTLVEELKTKNPRDSKGRTKARDHQWLTSDVGHPALSQHVHSVIGLMKASDTWEQFKRSLDRAYPKKGTTLDMFYD